MGHWKLREYNAWRSRERKERQAQQAERDLIQRRKKAEISDRQPHVAEIALLEQTIVFCESARRHCARKKGAGAKAIKHSIDTFKLFSCLQLSPPRTIEDIPEALERLHAQLAFYQEKVNAWEEGRSSLSENAR